MLGEHDGVDLAYGVFHRVVDDKVIVGVGGLKLDLGADEALLDLLGAVRSAPGQALLQRVPRGYFFTFLAKITRNLALDRYRESNRLKRSATIVELTGELSEIIAGNDDATANAESEELKNYINSFLRTLHKEKRNVFIRRYWYMDSVAEIADRYGISEGKIKTILFRVRNRLRQYLKKEGYYI